MPTDPLNQFLEQRSRETFEEVVRAHGPRTLQAAYRVLGDHAAAEDAAQNVFSKLLDLKVPAEGLRSPAAFLTTMAVNAARTELRSRGRRVNHEEVAAHTRREAEMRAAFTVEQIAEIRGAVSELPDPLRETVELRYFGSLRLSEVATALGVARRTVSARLKEARERLKGRLAEVLYSPVLVAIADGKTDAFPETAVESGRLQRLAALGEKLEPPRTGNRPRVIGLGAVATVLAVAVFFLVGATGDDVPAGPPDPEESIVAGGSASPGGTPIVRAPESNGNSARRGGAEIVAGSEAPGAAIAASTGPTGLVITVVDEAGELLTSGTIELGLTDYFPPPEVQLALAPFQKFLKPQHLEDANPLRIAGLPELVDGMKFTVEVKAEGRPPSGSQEIELSKGRMIELRLEMPLPATLSVTVTDRVTGRPLEGAAVVSVTEVWRRGTKPIDAAGTTAPGAAVTDGEGHCELGGLRPGIHEIAVSADGYRGTGRESVQTGAKLELALEPVGISGVVEAGVTDPSGAPIAGLRVELDLEGESADRVAKTDATGHCRFDGVPPGYHHLKINFDDWFELNLEHGWKSHEDMVLSASAVMEGEETISARLGYLRGSGLITGVVVLPDGTPAGGVTVSLGGLLSRDATSDAHGRVVFKDLPEGRYRLSVKSEQEGWDWSLTDEHDLAPGEAKDLRIPSGTATIRGTVLLPGGKKLQRKVMVSLLGPAFDMKPTSERGEFEFRGVPPGTYRIGVATRDFATPETPVTVGADSPAGPVTVQLLRGGRVLIDFEPGHRPALLAAKLTLRAPAGDLLNLDRDEGGVHDRVTGALPPGKYTLTVEFASGESRTVAFDIEDGEDRLLALSR